ncbi:hypothetical protein, partial [Pseudomonas syringae]|uniref:hypothetical protein n=1 Tax=Pseudomonas syringae TaxID=317 RepID=UPI001C820829
CLAAQGTETGIGLGEGLLNCAKKLEAYFLFDESELARESMVQIPWFPGLHRTIREQARSHRFFV